MASQSLYRKWRSQTFDELVGQEHVVQTLRNAIAEDRVAHAYLFTGPRGVGKTSMARLLAKAVNCSAPAPLRPCGQCQPCLAIAEGSAVDVIEMDAASHTSVDDARELIERVQFRPTSGRFKVYIIDEAHMLSTAAFNALLKTLEEPPAHAIFILATTEVHKVPATILSRCQRFTFTRHGVAATAAHLRQVAAAEQLVLEPGVAEAIARAATGSLRDALGVLEQLASFGGGAVTLEQVQSLLGMTSSAEVAALVEALLAGDLGAALQAVNGVAEQGADVRQFTRDLVDCLRAVMLLAAAGDRSLLDVGDDELARLEGWAGRSDVGSLVHWIKLFSGLDYQLRTSPYGHLPLELAVVEALVAPAPAARPAAAVSRPATPARPAPAPRAARPAAIAAPAAPDSPAAPPAAPAAAIAAPPAPAPALSIDELLPPLPAEDHVAEADPRVGETDPRVVEAANADISLLEQVEAVWHDLLRDVRPRDPMVQALLKDMRPEMVEGNTVVLLASSDFHRKKLEDHQKRRIVEEVLSKLLGSAVSVRCTTEKRAEKRDMRSQIREARKDEWVRAAANIFDAHVVRIDPDEE